jgi:hypothetical protein
VGLGLSFTLVCGTEYFGTPFMCCFGVFTVANVEDLAGRNVPALDWAAIRETVVGRTLRDGSAVVCIGFCSFNVSQQTKGMTENRRKRRNLGIV